MWEETDTLPSGNALYVGFQHDIDIKPQFSKNVKCFFPKKGLVLSKRAEIPPKAKALGFLSVFLLIVFKEGVDVMLTRLQEYRDRRKNRIEKEVEKRVAKEIEKAKEEAYQNGYAAAKSESQRHGK